MATRKTPFVAGEYYHCYNRGVDKRTVFEDSQDFDYFMDSLYFSNDIDGSGRIRERVRKEKALIKNKHVSILTYCLNQNHFHLLLRAEADNAISKFMQKVSTGYTMYFNQKYKRTGSLFQGAFQSRHVASDEYFRHLSVYITLNNEVHNIYDNEKFRSSANAFLGVEGDQLVYPRELTSLLDTDSGFIRLARELLPDIIEKREFEKELKQSVYID